MQLVEQQCETPEEAVLGVLCLLGDCVLADKWLSQWFRQIRFNFKITGCGCRARRRRRRRLRPSPPLRAAATPSASRSG